MNTKLKGPASRSAKRARQQQPLDTPAQNCSSCSNIGSQTIASELASGQKTSTDKLILVFEGNKVFSQEELLGITHKCLAANPDPRNEYGSEVLDYCVLKTKQSLFSKGYLQATVGEPKKRETEDGVLFVVPVKEGPLYRLGQVRIEGAKLFTPAQLLEMLTLKTGDIVDADSLNVWLNERVKKTYNKFGYIRYTADVEPDFHIKAEASEGIFDVTVTIDEGHAFTIRSIRFEGNGNVPEDVLLREMLARVGEVFNKELFDESLKRISQTGQFETIDADKDVDYRADNEGTRLDLTIHLKRTAATFE